VGKDNFSGIKFASIRQQLESKVLYMTLIAETVGRMFADIRDLKFYDEGAVGKRHLFTSAVSMR